MPDDGGVAQRHWLDARLATEWAEVRRLRDLGHGARADAHLARIDRLLDRYPARRTEPAPA